MPYGFAPGQVEVVRELVAANVDPGQVELGHHLVFADASRLDDLLAVLADPVHTTSARWGGIVDGDGAEYLVVFPAAAIDAAMALMAALQATDVRCRRLHVSDLAPIGQLVERARRSARSAHGVRVRRNTRHAAGA